MDNKYTVARYLFEGYEGCASPSKYLVNTLIGMMNEMKDGLYSHRLMYYEKDLRWVMTHGTFNWIVNNCMGDYTFIYEAQFDYTGQNRYAIYDIEVEFVNDALMDKNAEIKLTYAEPDDILCWTCIDKSLGMAFSKNSSKDIEIRKENLMKSFYIDYGNKVTITNVIFNKPATIVFWSDGTKTVVKRQKGDKKFDPEKGLAMAICKKVMGNKGNFNDIFKEWIEEE